MTDREGRASTLSFPDRRPTAAQVLALLLGGLLVAGACDQRPAGLSPGAGAPDAAGVISDGTGTRGTVGDDPDLATVNPHFFWLPPMVSQPDESHFGTFDPELQPTVRVVCRESTQLTDCDPDVALVAFTLDDGLSVEQDQYHANFDVRNAGLQTSDGESYTTYRIEVLTPELSEIGGPFRYGVADFQLGENGREARSLDTNETIGLIDNRTLPMKFRLDEGALEEELAVNTEPAEDATGEDAFCRINCSVTVIDPDEDEEASLTDEETGEELTAMLIPAGAVANTSETAVLIIDELEDDGDQEEGELCLTSGELRTEACFRYELSPEAEGDDFTEDVRFGICPEGRAVAGGAILPTWRLLKADEEDDEVLITRPTEVDVSDFLQCDIQTTVTLWNGPGGRLAAGALQWLVPPLPASDFVGGQLRDLSDLFWGEDVETSPVTSPPENATEGDTLQVAVELLGVHPNPDVPMEGREVTFTRTAGSGALVDPNGGSSPANGSITVPTDATGHATVDWAITAEDNRLEVSSPDARPATGTALIFQVEGVSPTLELTEVDLESSTMVINGDAVGYTATLENNTGSVQSLVELQAWVEQGATRRAAGGSLVFTCGENGGEMPPGSCTESFSYSASDEAGIAGSGSFAPGSATAVFELQVANVVIDEIRIPINLEDSVS